MVRKINSKEGSFLLSADLGNDPDARVGRRKRARQKAAEKEVADELNAEKRPRTSNQWLEEERRRTKLPTAKEGGPMVTQHAHAKPMPDADAVGKKKAKRLAQLSAKKAQKEGRKAAAEAKAVSGQSKDKKKAGDISLAASDMLSKCRGGVLSEQNMLALVAERIAGSPEKDLDLFDVFFELHTKGADLRTRQLALLSGVAVFKDLVPGYKIREPTEQEKAIQRSREVVALERHEMSLLRVYKKLLPTLEAAMRRESLVFAPALAALTKAASEFNYRQRLIGTAVKHATSVHDPVRLVLADALQDMVESDQRLEASREVVLAIGRLAQSAAQARQRGSNGSREAADAVGGGDPLLKSGGLKKELFKVLLHVPIGKAEVAALHSNSHELEGADEETRRGFAEASINQSIDNLRKAESELLMEIFVVYLRILRQRHIHGRDLMPAVLTGLGRWGQHVNLELLLEILAELRAVVQEALSQGNGLVSLQGLHCALVLLSGPSQALLTDVTWLADALKTAMMLALPSLCSSHSESSQWPPLDAFFMDGRQFRVSLKHVLASLESESVPALLLRCLEAALRCPEAYGRASDAALAQLIENLFVLAAASDVRIGITLLREAALLLRRHFRLHTLLEADGGLFGLGGVTDRAVSVIWHLQALAFSVSPKFAKAGQALASVVVNRRASVADLFPLNDARRWLAAEVVDHIGALCSVPAPHSSGSNHGKPSHKVKASASFLSETDMQGIVGTKG